MKYVGDLEAQIFNRQTGVYEPWPTLGLDRDVIRAVANGAPWRIAKCDRPLRPEMRNHYKEYQWAPQYRKTKKYLGLS